MKYKVGDKVLVRQWDDIAKEFGIDLDNYDYTKEMSELCGTVQEISDVNPIGYKLKSVDGYVFTDPIIERKVNEMTKYDLRTGHIVTLRNGDEFSVVLNVAFSYVHKDLLVNSCYRNWINLDFYNYDMTSHDMEKLDIVKVREPELYAYIGCPDDDTGGKVIYERKETKEITVADIEKELGYPVKIVKE